MATQTLPILLLNLNCELLYVINERLVAQGAPESKAQRVRNDIARTMFDTLIVDNMFEPQPVYALSDLLEATRHLTNCSIISVNEKSLAKLFDLMIMVFKYQFTKCTYAKELLGVTLNHLDTVHDTMNLSPETKRLVAACRDRVIKVYGSLGAGVWSRIRRVLSCTFQDKHTRVALFQQAGYQGKDGRFHIIRSGPVAPKCQPPGIITYYGSTESHSASQILFATKFVAPTPGDVDLTNAKRRGTILGRNLYVAAREGKIAGVEPQKAPPTDVKEVTAPPAPLHQQTQSQSKQAETRRQQHTEGTEKSKLAADEQNPTALRGLELLAGLVGGKGNDDSFPLMIFKEGEGIIFEDDAEEDVDALEQKDNEIISVGQTHSVVEVNAKKDHSAKALLATLDDDDDNGGKVKGSSRSNSDLGTVDAGEDLLALMDGL